MLKWLKMNDEFTDKFSDKFTKKIHLNNSIWKFTTKFTLQNLLYKINFTKFTFLNSLFKVHFSKFTFRSHFSKSLFQNSLLEVHLFEIHFLKMVRWYVQNGTKKVQFLNHFFTTFCVSNKECKMVSFSIYCLLGKNIEDIFDN